MGERKLMPLFLLSDSSMNVLVIKIVNKIGIFPLNLKIHFHRSVLKTFCYFQLDLL